MIKTKESEEMYLETILLLRKVRTQVRAIDVAAELGYAKSSVSRAIGLLQVKGYITVDAMGHILLTDAGEKKANDIYERHRVFTECFIRFGADRELAERDACRIEHVISDEMFVFVKRFVDGEKD